MEARSILTRRDFLRAGAALGGGLALAGCTGSTAAPSATAAAPVAAAGTAIPAAELEAASKKEGGGALWYLPGSPDMAAALKAGFEKAYPWTNVTTFSASLRDLPNKVLTESITGAPTADVIMLPPTFRQMLLQNDVITKSKLQSDNAMPKDLLDSEDYAHPCYILLLTMIYNTNSLKTPPTDPYALADPSWKDKISFDRVQNLGQATIWLAGWRKRWGDSKWVSWLNGLYSNNIFLTNSGGDTYAAILKGERVIGIGSSNDINAQKPGTPMAANYAVSPVPFIQYLYLTKRAAHPATGRLFMEWVTSDAGQRAVASTGRSPALAIDVPVATKNILPAGVSMLPGTELADFYARTDNYMTIMTNLWR